MRLFRIKSEDGFEHTAGIGTSKMTLKDSFDLFVSMKRGVNENVYLVKIETTEWDHFERIGSH